MKTISKLFILSSILVLGLGSCKKKKDDDNNPSDNNPNTTAPSCYLSSSDQTTGGITTSDTYTYNANGKLATQVSSISIVSTTTTYTYDGNQNLIKADDGGGDYTLYTYYQGKLSGARTYEGNALDQVDTIYTENGKPTVKSYNTSNELRNVIVLTLSGDNILSQQTTTYEESTGNMEDDVLLTFSDFDDKYSADYANRNHVFNVLPVSKHNPRKTEIVYKAYDNNGDLQSTTNSVLNSTYTYNDKNVVVKETGMLYVNGSTSASDTPVSNYSYSSCE